MKRLLSLILAAVLLISGVPITASAAKAATVEEKFKRLLDDYEFERDDDGWLPTKYYYSELAQYPEKDPDWVLIQGGMNYAESREEEHIRAMLGNKFVYADKPGAPFKLSFGVYDTKSGAFYDLLDAWDMDFENLRDRWNALPTFKPPGGGVYSSPRYLTYLMGDADQDGVLTVLDATRLQRILADLEHDDSYTVSLSKHSAQIRGVPVRSNADYDRDNSLTVMDATKIQRHIAELPNILDSKLGWDEHFYPHHDGTDYKTSYLVNSLKELDLSDSRLKKNVDHPEFDAEQKIRDAYDDDFFKNKSLLVLDKSLSSGSISLTFDNVSIDKDGVLNANFSYVEYHNSVHSGDINDRFIVIEVDKAFLDDVRDIKVNVSVIREKHYDSDIVFDKADRSYSFNKLDYELINAYEQLDSSNTYHKTLMNTLNIIPHPQEFFNEYAYLLIRLPLGSTSYTVDRVETAFDSDKTLNVSLIAKGPEIGNAAVNNRFICVKLSKSWLEDSDDLKVGLEYELEDFFGYRLAKLSTYNILNPGIPRPEIRLYRSYTDLNSAIESHQMLLDKYGNEFFDDYALVSINYELPSSSEHQFVDFIVEGDTLVADIYETAQVNKNSTGTQHVWYVFEVSKKFLKGATKARVQHIALEDIPSVRGESDVDRAEYMPKDFEKEGYTSLSFQRAYSGSLEDINYISSYWYERQKENPDLRGIVGVANVPYDMLELCYNNPMQRDGVWQYETFPPDTPFDLRDFFSGSVVVLMQRDDFSGKKLTINGLYLKGGKLTVDAALTVDGELEPRETYYVALAFISKTNAKKCTSVEVRRSYDSTLTAIHAAITPEESRELMSTAVAESASRVIPEIVEMPVSEPLPSRDAYDWSKTPLDDPTRSSGTGYVLLIRSRGELERYLPGFDQRESGRYFTDMFFQNQALIVMLGQGYDVTAQANMRNINIINGDTLYVDAFVSHEPEGEPSAPVCWLFYKVNRSDVKNISEIKLWKNDTVKNDFEYTADDHKVTITAYLGKDLSITVPESIEGDPVIGIAAQAFAQSPLKSVQLPSSLTDIGEKAFYFNTRLKTVRFTGNRLRTIGDGAFEMCRALTDIDIPDKSLQTIGEGVFRECMALERIRIPVPAAQTKLPNRTFYDCNKLTELTIPSHYTEIGDEAFMNSGITRITIPDSITVIGHRAFQNSALAAVTIPSSVKTLGDSVFYGTALETVSIPDSVTSMGSSVFERCGELKSAKLPKSLTSVPGSTFNYCHKLTSVTFPEAPTSIGASAFAFCDSMSGVAIPSSVTQIGASAFEKCISLTSLRIPGKVFKLGEKFAMNCTSLETVTFEDYPLAGFLNLVSLGASAFEGCTALREVSLPKHLASLGSRAFCGCTALEGTIDIPDDVKSILSDTFLNCFSLSRVTLSSNVTRIYSSAFCNCRSLTEITIPASVKSIREGAFRGCENLSKVTLSEGLQVIRENAFLNCGKLKSLAIPSTVTTMPKYAIGYSVDEDKHYLRTTDFTIYGKTGTRAETYALICGFTFIDPAISVTAAITPSDSRELMSKVVLNASSYKSFNTASLSLPAPSKYDFDWSSTPLDAPDGGEGYVLLIRNRPDFEKYFPGFDKKENYTHIPDRFFSKLALIAMLGQGYEDSATANMTDPALIDGDTLYLSAGVSYTQKSVSGAPTAELTAPICWKFLQVNQSDVADVKSIRFWNSREYSPMTGEVPFSVVEEYTPDGSFSDDSDSAAFVASSPEELASAITGLYEGYSKSERDHTFAVESYNNEAFKDDILVGLRIHQIGENTEINVMNIFGKLNNELMVSVYRYASTVPMPAMKWKIIFLRIPKQYKDYRIRTEVKDFFVADT